jgi:hypothetical protein
VEEVAEGENNQRVAHCDHLVTSGNIEHPFQLGLCSREIYKRSASRGHASQLSLIGIFFTLQTNPRQSLMHINAWNALET